MALHSIIHEAFGILRRHPLHLLCAALAFLAFVGEIYILVQVHSYGSQISIRQSDKAWIRSGTSTRTGTSTSCNDATTLRSYFFWVTTGFTAVTGLNLLIACIAVVRAADWRENYARRSLWRWVLVPVFLCFTGLISGILPTLLQRNDLSGTATLAILALYVQTLVWALVLAWRDVRQL